ncbi:MAG: hypothetical protein AAF729_01200, partial [Pseudomonadota bacterium]
DSTARPSQISLLRRLRHEDADLETVQIYDPNPGEKQGGCPGNHVPVRRQSHLVDLFAARYCNLPSGKVIGSAIDEHCCEHNAAIQS